MVNKDIMENCIVIDRLPTSLHLTEDEWEALLEEDTVTESAGVLTVDLLAEPVDDAIMAPALLVELMLENETELVVAQLVKWLPSRLAAEEALQVPRVRQLTDLQCVVPAADVCEMKGCATSIEFKVPPRASASRCFEPLSLKVEICSADRGTGSRLWLGGLVLAEWLWQQHCFGSGDVIRDRRVLELGAGFCGIPSRVAMLTGAAEVTATDGILQCVKGLERNAAPHGVVTRYLRWGQDECSVADVLLFADCVYSTRGAELLLECIDSCRRGCPECIIHGTFETERRAGYRDFLDGMAQRGYTAKREVLGSDLLAAVKEKLPKRGDDDTSNELLGIQLCTWHPHRLRLDPDVA